MLGPVISQSSSEAGNPNASSGHRSTGDEGCNQVPARPFMSPLQYVDFVCLDHPVFEIKHKNWPLCKCWEQNEYSKLLVIGQQNMHELC